MIDNKRFLDVLLKCGVEFFTGVPDSYLNGFCTCLMDSVPEEKNVVAANEGNAIAIAAGYFLSTGRVALVYMQNSGVGNAINPILSLAAKVVYSVPMVLLIGWRGEPGTKDHAQHMLQGKLTTRFLELMEIPYCIAENDNDLLEKQTEELIRLAQQNRTPVAIVARKGVFALDEKSTEPEENGYPLFREEAILAVLDALPPDTIYVATTGRASRELFFLREKRGEGHQHDFLNVGAMGHASSVALGLALGNKDRRVVCLDGDSALLMHMGSLSTVSRLGVPNFLHIVLNNGAHDSVGGQPSAGMSVDLSAIARGAGYETVGHPVATPDGIAEAIRILTSRRKPGFLDVRVKKGLRGKLPPLGVSSYVRLADELMQNLLKARRES